MDHWLLAILWAVARTALAQMVSAGVIACFVRRRWQHQPGACRWACLLVLLQGWLFLPLTVAVPWYDPPPSPADYGFPVTTGICTEGQGSRTGSGSATDSGTHGAERAPMHFFSEEKGTPATHSIAWVTLVYAVLAGAWFIGIVGILVVMIARYLQFVQTLPSLKESESEWLTEWRGLLAQHDVRRPISLFITQTFGPMLCRLPGGPAVLVPSELWRGISSAARRTILRHELAHYLRGDIWTSLLVRILALPQWFHPGAWWAVRMFHQCNERSCDQFAARTRPERISYAGALAHLADLRLVRPVAGHCAHAHPLLSRVHCLLTSPDESAGSMRTIALLSLAGVLLLLGAVRVDLVTKEHQGYGATADATARIRQLDQSVETLRAQIREISRQWDLARDRLNVKLARILELSAADKLSEEGQRRLAAIESDDCDQGLAAIRDVDSLGDEGLRLLAVAAKRSAFPAVRRQALSTALRLGAEGYSVLAYASESLPDADRVFLAESLVKDLNPKHVKGVITIAVRSGPEARDAVLRLAAESKQRELLFAEIGQRLKGTAINRLLERASQFEGNEGLVLLYGFAKRGDASQRIAAIMAASSRKQDGLLILAAAFQSKDPEVRAELVRAAKAIGGNVSRSVVQMAIEDPDESLRQAAVRALREA